MANTSLEVRACLAEKGVMCRLCVKYYKDSFNIFISNAKSGVALWNVIHDLLNVEVAEGDGLPDTVCHICLRKLMDFSEFKEMCIKSATKLKKNILKRDSKIDANEEYGVSDSLDEGETSRGENYGQDESRESDVYNVVCVPLVTDLIDNKEGDVSSESLDEEEEIVGEENVGVDEYQERRTSDGECLPLEMGNLVAFEEGVYPNDSSSEGENLDNGESRGRAVYNVVCVPLGMENQIPIKKEVDQSESLDGDGEAYQGEELGCESESQKRAAASDVEPGPLEMENMGDETSIARSIPKTHGKTLRSLRVEMEGRKPVKVKRKTSLAHNPSGHSVINDSSDHYRPIQSMRTIQGEGFETQSYAVDANILSGSLKEPEKKYEPLDSQKNRPCDWREYVCNYCGFKCPDKNVLYEHISSHILNKRALPSERPDEDITEGQSLNCLKNQELVNPYGCGAYGREFNQESNSLMQSVVHDDSKPFTCQHCGKGFKRKTDLCRHSVVHSGLKPFKCDACGKRFNQKSNLLSHSVIHTGSKPWTCEHCGKGFKRKSHLETHSVVHTGSKSFKCEVCGKAFNQKSNLVTHSVIHTNLKPYKCEICGKGFNLKDRLSKHSVIHIASTPYKCETCGKEFKQRNHLLTHSVIHSGLKPFKCETCGKECNRKSDLLAHSVVHSSSKPFKCKTCGKAFKRKSNLSTHSVTHAGLHIAIK